jgi:hypothetical protein
MIINIPFKVKNIANKLQLGIANGTKVGNKIARENHEEYVKDGEGNFIHTQVAGKPYLNTTCNNYFLIEGTVRVRYDWVDTDEFNATNIDEFTALAVANLQHADGSSSAYDFLDTGLNYIEAEYTAVESNGDWRGSSARVEPNCLKASIEIKADDTIIICPMQYQAGWTIEMKDIPVGGTVFSSKVGTEMYLFFGQDCLVGEDSTINKHDIKQQTSDNLTLINNSNKFCRLVRIYK